MSGIQKYKKIENYKFYKKVKKENNHDKRDKIHSFMSKKHSKIINIDTIFSKCTNDYSINKKYIQKSINEEEYFRKKINRKKIRDDDSNIHKKNRTNIEIDYNYLIKPDINSEIKKITEKKKFENKAHRRIQTEKRPIEIIKKYKKNGNRYILINTRNIKSSNNKFLTKYFFEGKKNNFSIYNANNSLKNTNYFNLTVNQDKSLKNKKIIKKISPIKNNKYYYKIGNSSMNSCIKSCNLESKNYSIKKQKDYPIDKRIEKIKDIFRKRTLIKNKLNYFSQDNSFSTISSIKLTDLKKQVTRNKIKLQDRKVYLLSKMGQSFELCEKIDLLSNSNINLLDYGNSFDDNNFIKKSKNQLYSSNKKKYSDIFTEKTNKKKTSNYNLKKILPYKINKITINNLLKINKIKYIKYKK